MNIFRTFLPPVGARKTSPALVCDTPPLRVLLLGWVGLLLYGCPISALLAGGTLMCLAAFFSSCPPVMAGALACTHVGLALFANELRAAELKLRGFCSGPNIVARDRADALMRLLDQAG